ncbi:MAG: hypothetical protein IPK17_00140 [Chloroflexi bacterium]|uniref:hypothetical protein n=1 Tax=Candidatus Flexifilum breve TaxID=3140694 RepID=UPI003136AA69|nr:hypothetical protein [Chloroflexota bacterium]
MNLGRALYAEGIDFDFIDFESLDRAVIDGNELAVAGERFRVLILPSMRAVRYSTLEKAAAFQRSGGLVLLVGALPEASDHLGANDPDLDQLVREITSHQPAVVSSADVITHLRGAFPPDFAVETAAGSSSEPLGVMHRRIGARDLYAVYGVTQGSLCYFRTHGQIELWDMWTGEYPTAVRREHGSTGTYVRLPLTEHELQLIVFTPDDSPLLIDVPGVEQVAVSEQGSVTGVVGTGGTYHGTIQRNGMSRTVSGMSDQPPDELVFDRTWRFELVPTLDNQWGIFACPRRIDASVRRFGAAVTSSIPSAAAKLPVGYRLISMMRRGPKPRWALGGSSGNSVRCLTMI